MDAVLVALITGVCTATPPTILAIAALITGLRKTRTVVKKLDAVHELANARLTDALNKIDTLTRKLGIQEEKDRTK